MVIKRIRNFIDIYSEYFKLSLRNMRKSVRCPMCNRHVSKINIIVLCKKCDEAFSKFSDEAKKTIIRKVKLSSNQTECSLCDEKNLEVDNKLYYCIDCDISFHQ